MGSAGVADRLRWPSFVFANEALHSANDEASLALTPQLAISAVTDAGTTNGGFKVLRERLRMTGMGASRKLGIIGVRQLASCYRKVLPISL
jgi:hypothetical protein